MVLRRLHKSQVNPECRPRRIIRAVLSMAAGSAFVVLACVGCSALPGPLSGGKPANPVVRPTFTPVLLAQTTAVLEGSLVANHAATLTAVPTVTPTPTETPTASPTPTATLLPTPFARTKEEGLRGWRGPDARFEYLGQAPLDSELVVLGYTPEQDWLQVCCISNQPAWVRADRVEVQGFLQMAQVLTPPATPTSPPLPTITQTPPPTSTPMPPFDIARGPEYPWKVEDGRLTIWVKVFEGAGEHEKPVAGYALHVLRDGVDVSRREQVSHSSAAGFDSTGTEQGGYRHNLKYEMPNAGEADWMIWLVDANGSIVSPRTMFTTRGGASRNLVLYIAYLRAR